MALTSMRDKSETQAGYDALLAGIFHKAYEDLVTAYQKQKRANTTRKQETAAAKARYLETWLRSTMPNWLELDPEKVIKWAKEEAENEQ